MPASRAERIDLDMKWHAEHDRSGDRTASCWVPKELPVDAFGIQDDEKVDTTLIPTELAKKDKQQFSHEVPNRRSNRAPWRTAREENSRCPKRLGCSPAKQLDWKMWVRFQRILPKNLAEACRRDAPRACS